MGKHVGNMLGRLATSVTHVDSSHTPTLHCVSETHPARLRLERFAAGQAQGAQDGVRRARLSEGDRLRNECLGDLHRNGATVGDGVARRHGASVEARHESSATDHDHGYDLVKENLRRHAGRCHLSSQQACLRSQREPGSC